tara:strand:- start:115310 stop:116110 length:801 start_codon:yes stop_codon:yes gene_type:complete
MKKVLILLGFLLNSYATEIHNTNVLNNYVANFKANVSYTNFSDFEKEKLQKALKGLLKVINSARFKKQILEHSFDGEKTFVDNNGMTNLEIYQHILKGAEDLLDKVDREMDLDLNMYYSLSGTIGYTYPDTLKIWINRRFFRNFRHSQVAANLIHEYMHKVGFTHDYQYTERRPYSVPYAVGKIMRKLYDGIEISLPSTLPSRPIYIPGNLNSPNNGETIQIGALTPGLLPESKIEESQDSFDQHHMTNQQDHYMGPCTDYPSDLQ